MSERVKPNRFFLSYVGANKGGLKSPGTGEWLGDEHDRDFLNKYSRCIAVQRTDDPRAVHSVPSVFARPIQFDQAFGDVENPLHHTIVQEWRGLLGAIALRRLLNLPVTVVPFNVPPRLKDYPEVVVGDTGEGDRNIGIILRSQLPKPEQDWEKWWLLYCGEDLVGTTSPWTMVYTPAQYICPRSIPWQFDGVLRDPISYFDPERNGRSYELAVLYRWVQLLLAEHKWSMSALYEAKAGHVKRELEQWRDQLGGYADPNVGVKQLGEPLIDGAPYSRFIRSVDEIPALPESDLLLASEKLGSAKNLVFARQGLDPNARIYKDLFVNRVHLSEQTIPEARSETAWKTSTGREVPLPYVFADDVFFPQKLMRIKLANDALNCGPLEAADFALPLTPAFFDYFYPQELIRNKTMLSVEVTSESIIATLKLPLRNKRALRVSKVYNIQTDIVTVEGATPTLAYWPDFFAADWKRNLAGCHLEPGRGLIVAPLTGQGSQLTATLDNGTQKPTRLWESELPLTGFALRVQALDHPETVDVGVVLRSSLTAPVARNNQIAWAVAVDFGTSSTTVLVRKAGHSPDVLTLEGRTTLLSGADGRRGGRKRHRLEPVSARKCQTAIPDSPL